MKQPSTSSSADVPATVGAVPPASIKPRLTKREKALVRAYMRRVAKIALSVLAGVNIAAAIGLTSFLKSTARDAATQQAKVWLQENRNYIDFFVDRVKESEKSARESSAEAERIINKFHTVAKEIPQLEAQARELDASVKEAVAVLRKASNDATDVRALLELAQLLKTKEGNYAATLAADPKFVEKVRNSLNAENTARIEGINGRVSGIERDIADREIAVSTTPIYFRRRVNPEYEHPSPDVSDTEVGGWKRIKGSKWQWEQMVDVRFPKAFAAPPLLFLNLTSLDDAKSFTYSVQPKEVTGDHFRLILSIGAIPGALGGDATPGEQGREGWKIEWLAVSRGK